MANIEPEVKKNEEKSQVNYEEFYLFGILDLKVSTHGDECCHQYKHWAPFKTLHTIRKRITKEMSRLLLLKWVTLISMIVFPPSN